MKITVINAQVFAVGKGGLAGYGGLEQIAWLQAKGLAKKGHQVSFCSPDGSECEGCTIIPTGPAGQIREKDAYSRYWQQLASQDVIVDHSWEKWSLVGKHEGWLKAPVLGWMHAPIHTMYRELPPIEKPTLVCISEDQRNHFEAFFGRPARTCYNGVDVDCFYRPLQCKRNNRLLFLARFSTIKGPDLAIEGCRQAGAELDLVGDTKLTGEPEYLEQIKKLCDGTAIKIVGPASRGECVHWFSRALCMLHPNQRFREPFGLAPVEAQACGCPVIAWDYGAMRETVTQDTGWLVSSFIELVNAIKKVQQEGIPDTMREACITNAQRFSVPNMVNRCEQLCIEAVETGGW